MEKDENMKGSKIKFLWRTVLMAVIIWTFFAGLIFPVSAQKRKVSDQESRTSSQLQSTGQDYRKDGRRTNPPSRSILSRASVVQTYQPLPTQVTPSSTINGLEEAIKKASISLVGELPKGTKIAVVNIASDATSLTNLVIDELEFQLVSAKSFTIADRSTLDAIRKEQAFQMSGAVNDDMVITAGNLSGASVVITGQIITSVAANRVSLKALNVKTGQIIAMTRESF